MLILREVVITSTPSAILTSRAQLENTFTFLLSAITILCPWSGCNIWTGWFLCNTTYHNLFLQNDRTKKLPVLLGELVSSRISEQQVKDVSTLLNDATNGAPAVKSNNFI